MNRLESPRMADGNWKKALKGVAAAALRLHHYRFMRTRMLHDALASSRDGIGSRRTTDEPRN